MAPTRRQGLCELRLPWGQKLRAWAWDDLLWGGHDKCPTQVPSRIRTTVVARTPIRGIDGEWELRAVRVEPVGKTMTAFQDGWPFPRPSDAVRPLRIPGVERLRQLEANSSAWATI
jgi:hypothetical protein